MVTLHLIVLSSYYIAVLRVHYHDNGTNFDVHSHFLLYRENGYMNKETGLALLCHFFRNFEVTILTMGKNAFILCHSSSFMFCNKLLKLEKFVF
jgi:hypothetical protein